MVFPYISWKYDFIVTSLLPGNRTDGILKIIFQYTLEMNQSLNQPLLPQPLEASISAQVYDRLKLALLRLEIPPGTVLQEAEVALRYGCSRTPAREAVRRLVQEGLAVRRGRLYAVRQFSPAEVRDLYEVREGLEKMVVRLVIERASETDMAVLWRCLDEQHAAIEAHDKSAFSKLDTHFHATLAALSQNALLEEQLAPIYDRVMLVRVLELSRDQGMTNAFEDHRRIVDALMRRNVDAAEAEMRYHIRSIVARYHGYAELRPIHTRE